MKIIYFDEGYLQDCVSLFMSQYNSEDFDCGFDKSRATAYLEEIILKPRFVGILALKKNRVLGFAFCHLRTWSEKDDLVIDELLVKTEKQNEGIGSMLLEFIESYAINYNLAGITATTNVQPLTQFYQKNEFLEHNLSFLYKGVNNT